MSQLPWETRPPCPKVQQLHISFEKVFIMAQGLHIPPPRHCLLLSDTNWEDAAGKWILPIGIGPHCLKALSIKHTSKPASSGGRKMQENPEAAASLVAVTALMKAHPQRKSARQAIQRF